MKNFYFILYFFSFSLFVSAQTSLTGSSTEVGITEGELSVSLTGAANYKIPLVLPPGINGFVPQISLAYNSQGGIGLAGYGWNIMGISAITRIPSTMYHDGVIDPVDFNELDRFALDDKRLILKSSEKFDLAATKRIYETEIFSNLKITYYKGFIQNNTQDITLSPIDYFIVEHPDGSSAKYENHGSATDWTISYWENPQGVFISYEYYSQYSGSASPSNNASIEKIKYGSLKSSGTPINEVQFIYKGRYRVEQAYVGGKSFIRDKVLSAINVKNNGIGFRNYSLTHDSSSLNYERLTSITEKSGDGTKSYNPTVFSYEENITSSGVTSLASLYTFDSINYGDESTPSTIIGDFDGDGDLDFMNDKVLFTKFYDDGSQPIKTDVSIPFSEMMKRADGKAVVTIKCLDEINGEYKLMNKDSWCRQYSIYEGGKKTKVVFDIHSMDLNSKIAKLDYTKQFDIPSTGRNEFDALVGDFNGDGLTDKIIYRNVTTSAYSGNEYFYDVQFYFVNLDRRISTNYIKDLGAISKIHYNGIQVADVNGDGKSDLIFFRAGSENSIVVYTFDENNNLTKLWETPYSFIPKTYYDLGKPKTGTYVPGSDYPILSGDYNGDGKTDFILFGDEKKMLLSTGKSFVTEPLPSSFASSFDLGTVMAVDFNNDGKTDVLNLKSNQTRNLQPLSEVTLTIDCLTRSSAGIWASSKNTFSNLKAKFFGAFNPIMVKPSKLFNGKPELLLYEMETVLGYSVLANGQISNVPSNSYPEALKVGFFVKNDALTPSVKNLKSVTVGNGVKETITYSPLTDASNVYTVSPQIENFPNIDIKSFPGYQVVSKIEKQSKSIYKKRMFSYYGAVSNAEGLGFLGFRSTVQTNWHNDTSPIISYISKNDISLRGANVENYTVLGMHDPLFESPNKIASAITKEDNYIVTGTENLVATQSIVLKPDTWIKSGSTFSAKINKDGISNSINEPSTFIFKQVLGYESNLFSNKVFKIKNILNQQINGLENIKTETTTDYDEYNNPKRIIEKIKDGSTSITDIVYEDPSVSPYLVGRPVKKSQNVTVADDQISREELYFYNSKQLLSQIKKKGDATTNYTAEDNEYDTFGNITKKITKAGSDIRETNYEYDPTGRFVIKTLDVEKLATTFQYNANGTLKSKTNPFAQTILYEYDSWFKKIKETDYFGNKIDYKYVNSGGNTIITKTGSLGSGNEEVYDDLGRKIKAGAKNIMGSFTYVSYLYDIEDRNFKVSDPYIGATPSLWNETKYDEYGRMIFNNASTGKVTSIVYDGRITKVNDGTISKTYEKDATGNIISMFDMPGNEIKYKYHANGSLKESDYNGIKTKILQDGWGRKKRLEDPSAGVFEYKYNDFGELLSEKTPNGITTYILDPVGKITEKTVKGTYTDSRTKYEYNSSNKLLNNSRFEDFTNGTNAITTQYIYDELQRLSEKTETTPYATFTKNFKYDSSGRLDTEGSIATRLGKSSSKTVKYNYKNGEHFQILDYITNSVLWQKNTVNARGQLLSGQNGPILVTNSYDVSGYPLQFKNDKTVSATNILTLNTSFDIKKEYLKSRTNSLFAWNENFEYDNLDRLTDYNNFQGAKENQYYDNQGKITQNSLGTYSYLKQNPYQNAAISLTTEGLAYYTEKPSQIINYNVFKSPVLIDEQGVDKISFDYNDNNERTAMFSGDLQDDKLKRPYRKYYSADGSMEIKENIETRVSDFVTYIGGDGYSAPIIFKSDGVSNNKYLYLQRDYQGSIISIADATGAVVEKRLFDAWGGIVKVQDGAGNTLAGLSILDRGYTGHEHIQSVGLINMNGRLYDPKLHRFLQPDNNIQDPFNTQNYNRYGYVLNNPTKYTDPSGEFINIGDVLGFIFSAYVRGGAASGGEANPFKWDANAWTSAFAGAASSAGSFYASKEATGFANNYIDNYNNKPVLGASAVGSGYNGNPFVNDSPYSFRDDPNNTNEDNKNSGINGDLATVGSLIGATSGMLNEFSVMQFYNAAPKGTFAVNYNGSLRYWSESFKGGTRAKIPSILVESAKVRANSAKFVSKLGSVASVGGTVLSYYGAGEEFINGNYGRSGAEAMSSTTSLALTAKGGNVVGLAWTIGWEGGRWISNRDFYDDWYRNVWHPYRFRQFGY